MTDQTTRPNPQRVREIAREFLTDPNLTADELDYIVRLHTGRDVPDEEFRAWRDAVRDDADDAEVATVATWPDEQTPDETEPPRFFTDIDRDTNPYLRVRAFINAARQKPDTNGQGLAAVIDNDGVTHVLAEQDVQGVLDDHGEMQEEIDRLIGELLKIMGARDGHRRRQVDAERALMLMLIREGGRTEFTPKEMVSAPADGSFVSSRDATTGNEVLEFRAARRGPASPAEGHDDA